MTKSRWIVNGLSLAVIFGGALLLPGRAQASVAEEEELANEPAVGGTCCDQANATCYLNLGGVIIRQSSARSC